MKTTVELPDSLVREAKKLAVEQGRTLRALIQDGLEREVSEARDSSSRDIVRQLKDGFADPYWSGKGANNYVVEQRKG